MSDSYDANIYLKPSDLNNIEDRIEELTEECQERIFGKDDTTYSGTDFQIDTHNVIKGDLIQIDGQTSQSGTPTPSTPQPINVVSGRQLVSVISKNLFDYTTTDFSNPQFVNIQTQDNIITMTTTTTTNSSNLFFRTKIPDTSLVNGETYTISSENVSGVAQSLKLQLRNKDGSYISGKSLLDSVIYDDTYSLYVVGNIYATSGTTSIPSGTTAIIKNVQVEKGTSASNYEEYKGNDYEINLGKNMFDINGIYSTSGSSFIRTWEDGVATLTWTSGFNFYLTSDGQTTFTFDTNETYTFSFDHNGNALHLRTDEGNTNRFSTNTDTEYTRYSYTFTGISSLVLKFVRKDNSGTAYLKNFQIEKGSSASSFSPYKIPIELCKIGDYRDRLFKNTIDSPYYDNTLELDSWYIHKEIGKVVLNGSETINYRSAGRFDIEIPSVQGTYSVLGLSNYYIYADDWTSHTNTNGTFRIENTNWGTNKCRMSFKNTNYTSLNEVKTGLQANNVIVYFQITNKIGTPTDTLIEDEELINQLESIQLLNGLNNIVVSSAYLNGIITIKTYLESFYRNIKVGDDLGGKTLYLSFPRTSYENISDEDIIDKIIAITDGDSRISYRYYTNADIKGIVIYYKTNSSTYLGKYLYACYSTKINPYMNVVRIKLPKDFGEVINVNMNDHFYQYIKIYDESIIPDYTKHTWADNEVLTMQKIDNIERGIRNIGFYYEKPDGWVNEKEWLGTNNIYKLTNYGVGVKTISYQDLNRWYNNLDLIDFSDLNEITVWNTVNDISQIEWNGESDEEWVDNFNLVLYDFTTENDNTLITENGDTMLVLVNERV